ncbi:sugar ABC transporter substrate-binding protein [Mesorhizobium sp. B2-1-8]|uniref:sugar ABC transporter substrate-binding protein n=1 Tax=unclassified Mesorhizobium TaxID=325217 RepID=UPI00112E1A94|nr:MULTISPECIES: sugar ABC transporter substrate-binding protein [unclassified Mesorhizobium]MBZ9672364.1 sugar ABC transporter substrate-binding protein [Mesorhizobium sp. ES1-3]MBZ9710744.1 sugar ABC transporter substrate-binding protein [Mesorhizobium sp. ESP7-2]TPI31974.1 sugar ABC transporter substrate-binding protein [Mesorhizobium sp. B3-2-1]UCI21616.1 sugar ABC transporter substrate-binding protein [Mesorhizobium sp. B2-1-8]
MIADHEYTNRGQGFAATRRTLLQIALGAGGAASLAALAALPASAAADATQGDFPQHKPWKFVFVNHVTTNPFFVPTQYGIADACALLGCSYQWTGSQQSIASEMVNAMNTAIAAGVDGIAVCLVDEHAFNEPVSKALAAGIPVFAYNADAKGNARLAYVGQDLYLAGKALGERIVSLVDEGEVVGFIATPGQLNIQPRLDGAADAIKASGKKITFTQIATGPTVNEEVSRVDAYYVGHKDVKGIFAVDAGSTMAVGKTMEKYGLHANGVRAGGFDLLPATLDAIAKDHLDFTIDQQPYLQGFYAVMEMFLFQMSGGLTGPADINTGLKFVTKDSVQPYLKTQSRYEGNASKQMLIERSGAIGG